MAIDQYDVAADAEGGNGSVCRGGGMGRGGHERRRGKRPGAVQIENGLIDPGREPEVVSIE